MSTFQTLLATVALIYVLCVIVQGVQEVIKSLLDTKARTMAETINKFMGGHLTLAQVKDALETRGLDIADLEHFNKDDFRKLLDGIELLDSQAKGIVASTTATLDQVKDNMAASYEAARISFQKSYTAKNKRWVIALSFLAVLVLNASVIRIYEILAASQNLSQAIAGTASAIASADSSTKVTAATPQGSSPADVYQRNRDAITKDLQKYPVLLRTKYYSEDFQNETFNEIAGLLLMGILVSLGAPFWNDVLKGMMGVNNALNAGGKKTQ